MNIDLRRRGDRRRLRIGVIAVLFVVLFSGWDTSALAQDNSQVLTIQALVCPAGYADENFGDDCTTPAAGFEYIVKRSPLTSTDESGNASFDITGDPQFKALIETFPGGDYGIVDLGCVSDGEDLSVSGPGDNGAAGPTYLVDVPSSSNVDCTIYYVSFDARTSDSGSGTSDQTSDVTALPDTGIGSAHHAATDDRLPILWLLLTTAIGGFWLRQRPKGTGETASPPMDSSEKW